MRKTHAPFAILWWFVVAACTTDYSTDMQLSSIATETDNAAAVQLMQLMKEWLKKTTRKGLPESITKEDFQKWSKTYASYDRSYSTDR